MFTFKMSFAASSVDTFTAKIVSQRIWKVLAFIFRVINQLIQKSPWQVKKCNYNMPKLTIKTDGPTRIVERHSWKSKSSFLNLLSVFS